jgi:hypothetical protein
MGSRAVELSHALDSGTESRDAFAVNLPPNPSHIIDNPALMTTVSPRFGFSLPSQHHLSPAPLSLGLPRASGSSLSNQNRAAAMGALDSLRFALAEQSLTPACPSASGSPPLVATNPFAVMPDDGQSIQKDSPPQNLTLRPSPSDISGPSASISSSQPRATLPPSHLHATAGKEDNVTLKQKPSRFTFDDV